MGLRACRDAHPRAQGAKRAVAIARTSDHAIGHAGRVEHSEMMGCRTRTTPPCFILSVYSGSRSRRARRAFQTSAAHPSATRLRVAGSGTAWARDTVGSRGRAAARRGPGGVVDGGFDTPGAGGRVAVDVGGFVREAGSGTRPRAGCCSGTRGASPIGAPGGGGVSPPAGAGCAAGGEGRPVGARGVSADEVPGRPSETKWSVDPRPGTGLSGGASSASTIGSVAPSDSIRVVRGTACLGAGPRTAGCVASGAVEATAERDAGVVCSRVHAPPPSAAAATTIMRTPAGVSSDDSRRPSAPSRRERA